MFINQHRNTILYHDAWCHTITFFDGFLNKGRVRPK